MLLVLGCCVLLGGCRARTEASGPSIEFTRVPPAAASRTDKFDIIQGRANGARPGQQIVLYAKTGAWWIQPTANLSFTKIQADSSWINSTRLGLEYAALLVEPEYSPKSMLRALPEPGGGVVAVATVQGATSGPTVSPPLNFSGYEWRVRNAPSSRGDTMNLYDPANAWTDDSGALHLRTAKRDGKWTCAEVTLARSFGYGTYSFTVRDTSHLEPAAVFAMFTWDYAGGDQNNREMDIEISRWGDPMSENAQYEVQPFYVPANVFRFNAPPGLLTHSFHWEPGRVVCKTVRGPVAGLAAEAISEHAFTSGVPAPGAESVRMALFIYGKTDNPMQNDAEVVIEKFEYLP
ncbi:MAG: glycoside hydrolase family 16 protein [Blastocatellia bacterium]